MRIIAGAHKGRVLKTVSGRDIVRPWDASANPFSHAWNPEALCGGNVVCWIFSQEAALWLLKPSAAVRLKRCWLKRIPGAAALLSKNAATLGVEDRCRILVDDVLKITARTPSSPFQVIFIDPPYGESLFAPTLRNIIRRNWLDEDGFLIAEVEKTLRLNAEKQPGLEVVNDTLYGQTRVIVWTAYHD